MNITGKIEKRLEKERFITILIDGEWYNCFDKNLWEDLQENNKVTISYKTKGEYRNIITVKLESENIESEADKEVEEIINRNEKELNHNQRARLGQAYNIAHKEYLNNDTIRDDEEKANFLIKRTNFHYNLLNDIERKILKE